MRRDMKSKACELDRLLNLSDYNVDFTALANEFKYLTELAAKIAGTDISLINLIDSHTQWTISDYGFPIEQMPRCESVCQYTIEGQDALEIEDLSEDIRSKEFPYVKGELGLRFYLGVPLTTDEGHNIGALCVLDTESKKVSAANIELLKTLAHEIVARLKALKSIELLNNKVLSIANTQKRLVHDIRGPVAGIIGLASILGQPDTDEMKNLHEYVRLIKKSGNTILELANDILRPEKSEDLKTDSESSEFNLLVLKGKLERLYLPQAISKKIEYTISISRGTSLVPFPKNKLLQIVGNLISNAIKFTPLHGRVSVELNLEIEELQNQLSIVVRDTGLGLTDEQIILIQENKSISTPGTHGEEGFGLGLVTVKYMVDSLQGQLKICSVPGEGTVFEVILPEAS